MAARREKPIRKLHRLQVAEMRAQRVPVWKIARELGISEETVRKDWNDFLRDVAADIRPGVEVLRAEQLALLDAEIEYAWKRLTANPCEHCGCERLDPSKALPSLTRALEQRAKLLGLYNSPPPAEAPEERADATTNPPPKTPEEALRRLRELGINLVN